MIKLIAQESHNGLTELVAVSVEDFADDSQVRDVLDAACSVLGRTRGGRQRWRRDDDCCYEVPGGFVRKNGGKKALDRVEKELGELGYGQVVERQFITKEQRR